VFQFDRLLSRSDTRDLATRWLLEQGPDAVAVTRGYYAQVHLLDPALEAACRPVVPAALWRDVPELPPGDIDWGAFVGSGPGFWGSVAHNAIEDYLEEGSARDKARFVLAGQGVLPCGKAARPENLPPLEPPCFKSVAVIDPGRPACD